MYIHPAPFMNCPKSWCIHFWVHICMGSFCAATSFFIQDLLHFLHGTRNHANLWCAHPPPLLLPLESIPVLLQSVVVHILISFCTRAHTIKLDAVEYADSLFCMVLRYNSMQNIQLVYFHPPNFTVIFLRLKSKYEISGCKRRNWQACAFEYILLKSDFFQSSNPNLLSKP